jgi:hypothetical protein
MSANSNDEIDKHVLRKYEIVSVCCTLCCSAMFRPATTSFTLCWKESVDGQIIIIIIFLKFETEKEKIF